MFEKLVEKPPQHTGEEKNSGMTNAIMKSLVFVTSNFAFQNFWTVEEMCVPWSWFLALDFQFFMLALLILAALLYVPPVAPVRSLHKMKLNVL
jgi:hypothetical protein